MSLFFLIVPLLIFVIVDSFATLNVALLMTILITIAEGAYSYFILGGVDSFSIFSFSLIFILGFFSFSKQSRKIFYLKPAILSFSTGLFLLGSYLLGHDVLVQGLDRMKPILGNDAMAMLEDPRVQSMFKVSPMTIGIASLAHGAVATYAALEMKRWGWFWVAGVSGYLFLFLGCFGAILLVS